MRAGFFLAGMWVGIGIYRKGAKGAEFRREEVGWVVDDVDRNAEAQRSQRERGGRLD